MAVQSIDVIKSWFETGDKPTQAQYSDVWDSFAHLQRDSALLNLRKFSSTRQYKADECAVYNGVIYIASVDTIGAFDSSKWIALGSATSYDGFPDYDNTATYNNTINSRVTYQFRLFKCTVASIQGVPPLNANGTVNANWQEVSANSGEFGEMWTTGVYNNKDVVRHNDLFYELEEANGFESTNIDLEIAGGSWKLLTFKIQDLAYTAWSGITDSTASLDKLHAMFAGVIWADGSVAMTNNLNVNNHSINNVANISGGIGGAITFGNLQLDVGTSAANLFLYGLNVSVVSNGDYTIDTTNGVSYSSTGNGTYATVKTDYIVSDQTFQFPANGGTFEVSYYKGIANGYAGLDASGKVPTSQLPAGIVGAMQYQGTWNPATNTPAIASGVGTPGYFYKVSVTSNATIVDGNGNWHVGDWIVFNGTTWDKIDNYEAVTTVFGRVGDISLLASDVTSALTYTPANKAGDVFSGLISFSGTGHAGIKLNSLTTTQRDAIVASVGMIIWNTTTSRYDFYNGSGWMNHVRLSGDTMTGDLLWSVAANVGTSNNNSFSIKTNSTVAATFDTSQNTTLSADLILSGNSKRIRITDSAGTTKNVLQALSSNNLTLAGEFAVLTISPSSIYLANTPTIYTTNQGVSIARNVDITATVGGFYNLRLSTNYAPGSGSTTYNAFQLDGNITPASGAGGTIRSIYINHTLGTLYGPYYAIEATGGDFKIANRCLFDVSKAQFSIPVELPSYSKAGLPSLASKRLIWVSDDTSGACIAYCDGANWKRIDTNAIIS